MLLSKAQLLVGRVASTESARPQINGIHVGQDGTTCATDGHRMLVCKPAPSQAEYPSPSPDWVAPSIPKEGFILPSAAAADAIKSLPKKVRDGHFPSLAGNVLVESMNGRVTLASTDLDSWKRTDAKPVDGPFPNYHIVFPKDEPTFSISLNAQYVKDMAEAFVAMSGGSKKYGDNAVTIEFHGNLKACVWRKVLESGEEVTGLLMPLRIPNPVA